MKKHGNSILFGTATLKAFEYQIYEEKVSRWILLKWLLRGTMRLRWLVDTDNKDKTLHIEPNKEPHV